MKTIKIYGASRATLPARPAMWKALRKSGASIVSTWIDEADAGVTSDFSELWYRIECEIRSADRLVLYVEIGDFPLKGALVEVGMALAMGKPVFIVAPNIDLDDRDFKPLGSWAKHPNVSFCDDIHLAVGINVDRKVLEI